jgi:hypothetical protein
LNNNRGNNNRRRGRGNRQNNNGGQQLNRIDSRARGNAPQLLEKYRKLAQDAHLNGDRVQAEYYLQFADHYFRVIADTRLRQEEQRMRRDDRWEGPEQDSEEGEDFGGSGDFPTFDQPTSYARQPRPARNDEREARDEREPREEVEENDGNRAEAAEEPGELNPYEPPENPFIRDNRDTRDNRNRGGLRPRRDRAPRRDDRDSDAPVGLDPASLPPAISASRAETADAGDAADADAKPKRGRPRRKPSADDAGGEALESVG